MNKKCYILNSSNEGKGVIKIEKAFPKNFVLVDIKDYPPLEENEIFDVYFVTDSALKFIGYMNSGKHKFSNTRPSDAVGVAIVRKNLQSKEETLEFWGGDVKECVESIIYKTNDEESILNKPYPDEFTADTYFGGGFRWKRINGYYSVHKYSIIMYVMSIGSVRQAITKRGYYLVGEKKEDEVCISVAVPVSDKDEKIYGEIEEYAYPVIHNGKLYSAVCVAVDESGEFFLYY